jgi:XTP/dITP diphosphohydrolase
LKLLLATGNRHKAREFGNILNLLHCELALEGLETADTVEGGATYYQNAYRKAVSGRVAQSVDGQCGDVIFADDSGLELSDYGGIPGVHSARFEYQGLSERTALAKFLNDRGVASTPARFVCWIVAFLPWAPVCFACSGTVDGIVTASQRGSGGFGYDPMFIPDGYKLTFSEMEPSLKDTISHRARAMKELWTHVLEGEWLRP